RLTFVGRDLSLKLFMSLRQQRLLFIINVGAYGLLTQPVFQVDEDGRVAELGAVSFLRGGGTWVDLGGRGSRFHEGLPPAMSFAAPSGYLGARIAKVVAAEIGVPSSLRDWSDDHRVKFLCSTGSDVAGSLMWGASSFAAHMASRQTAPIATADIPRAYQELANATSQAGAGSSAGGEQPKFTCETEARGHLIVKFARTGTRSSEMLILEELTLRALHEAGIKAALASYSEIDGYGFLEVERFDRVGRFGRRGMISAGAIDDERFGMRDNWPSFAQRCEEAGMLGPDSVRRVLILTAFSELIGNGDRHFENLSLMTDERGRPVKVSPAYDMLPMMYAPVGGGIEPALRLVTPSFQSLGARSDIWVQAFQAAHAFWLAAAEDGRLSSAMRGISAGNARQVVEVVAPLLPAREDPLEVDSSRRIQRLR
ncbi:MAG: HipA domain-containing protein, partial [Variovorax sp.]